jgi:hypothetical protein
MTKGNFVSPTFFFGLLSRLAKAELIYGRFMTTADRMRKLIYTPYFAVFFINDYWIPDSLLP